MHMSVLLPPLPLPLPPLPLLLFSASPSPTPSHGRPPRDQQGSLIAKSCQNLQIDIIFIDRLDDSCGSGFYYLVLTHAAC